MLDLVVLTKSPLYSGSLFNISCPVGTAYRCASKARFVK